MGNPWSLIERKIESILPKPNDKLYYFKERKINKAADYFDTVFNEMCRVIGEDNIQFLGHEILSPEQRVERDQNQRYTKGKIETSRTDAIVVEYKFECLGKKRSAFLKIPHMRNNTMHIQDTKYYFLFNIAEPPICYVGIDEISTSFMRGIVKFSKKECVLCKPMRGKVRTIFLLNINAYQKNRKSKLKATPLNYLFVKFGVFETLAKFGFSEKICFINEDDIDDNKNYYYPVGEFFLKADREEMDKNVLFQSIVAQMLYMLKALSKDRNISRKGDKTRNLFKELSKNDNYVWLYLLGKSVCGTGAEAKVVNDALRHMKSFDSYLDKQTREELRQYGYPCETIYDFLITVMVNINEFINKDPSDLFQKRITAESSLFQKAVNIIFTCAYGFEAKSYKLKREGNGEKIFSAVESDISGFFNNISVDCTKIGDHKSVRMASPIYNDNFASSVGYGKVRLGISSSIKKSKNGGEDKDFKVAKAVSSSRCFKVHVSYLAIESALSSSGFPCIGGTINPFIEINDAGQFIEPEYYKDLKDISLVED